MDVEAVTREIFWNISLVAKVIMYLLLLTSFFGAPVYLAYQWWNRVRLGHCGEPCDHWPERLRRFVFDGFGQGKRRPRTPRWPLPICSCLSPFSALFIATGLVTLEHDTPLHFYFGAFLSGLQIRGRYLWSPPGRCLWSISLLGWGPPLWATTCRASRTGA